MKILLISGKAQHGKSTLAQYIKNKLESKGETVIVDSFAKYIKMYAKQLGWDGVTKDEYWRGFLQKLGTDIIQDELNMKTYHAHRMAEDMEIMKHLNVGYYVVDDNRFRREINYIKSIFPDDTISIKVVRVGFKSGLTAEQLKHKSEIDLNDYNSDYVVYHQSGVQHLYDEADRVLNKLF